MVDDNRDWLRITSRAVLRGVNTKANLSDNVAGLAVDQADNIRTAIDKLTKEKFDVLIVDLRIPGLSGSQMGGLDLIDESLKMDRLRPIIVITGYGTISLARRTLTQGVFDFIEKSETATQDLIEAIQRAIDNLDEKSLRLGNPFTPMTGVDPVVFGGRLDELEFFEQKVSRLLSTGICEHFLVLGQWGVGKSTLLREFKRISQSRGHLTSIVSLSPVQQGSNLDVAAQTFIEGLLRDIPYPTDRFRKVSSFFDSVGINVLGTGLEFSRDTTRKEISAQAFLHDTLVRLWEDLEPKTDALIILLDDFDNFSAVPEFGMLLKQTLSMESIRATKILVGIASAPLSWLRLTSVARHHPISRYFLSRVELQPLTKKEVTDTIQKSLEGTNILFEQEIIERVFDFTQGHPFEMQLLCYHLFQNQISRVVDLEVWEKALHSSLEDMGVAVFGYWLNHTTDGQREILNLLARAEETLSLAEISLHFSDLETIEPDLEILLDLNLIGRSSQSKYHFIDKMFAAYLQLTN